MQRYGADCPRLWPPRFAAGVLALGLSITPHPLLAQDCFDDTARAEESYAAYFDVALGSQLCSEAEGTAKRCIPLLQRRNPDYFISVAGGEVLSLRERLTMEEQILRTRDEIAELTSVNGYFDDEKRKKGDGFKVFLILDRRAHDLSADEVFDDIVSSLILRDRDLIKNIFHAFAENDAADCISFVQSSSSSTINLSTTWIKYPIDRAKLSDCTMKGLVGGMGLDVSDLDEERVREGLGDIPGRRDIPKLFRAFLRVHYSTALAAGWSEKQMRSATGLRSLFACEDHGN